MSRWRSIVRKEDHSEVLKLLGEFQLEEKEFYRVKKSQFYEILKLVQPTTAKKDTVPCVC